MLAVSALAFAGAADARTSDRTQPMDIEGDGLQCDLGGNGECTYSGNVLITQGTLNVRAAKATIQRVGDDPSRALLSGGVTLKQVMDNGSPINATASNVDYNLKTEVVVFTGNVELSRNGDTMKGQRFVYNMKTAQIEAGNGSATGRVKMRILPKNTQQAPAPAKASN